MVGMMTSVRNVDVVSPPMMTRPMGAQVAARPSTGPNHWGKRNGATMGTMPRMVVMAVMRMGRRRCWPPRTMASVRSIPSCRRWLM